MAGTRDEYCPAAALDSLREVLPRAQVTIVESANHFFFGKLFPLGEAIATWARTAFPRGSESAPREAGFAAPPSGCP